MWRPAIEYPLAVTSFTRDQCLRLQKAYTGTFLSHMGIASTTSRALIFGSSHYSGFNLPELWVSQGTTHLTYLLGHLNAEDEVGVLLRITLDNFQLHLGFPLPPLTYPYSSIAQYIEPSWLTTTWDFMDETSALLTLSDPCIIPLERQNDCHLMPRLISLAATFSITASDIIKFNRCRLYLQVLTLSDIVDSTGNTIDKTIESPISPGPNKLSLAPPAGQFGDTYSHASSPSNLAPFTFALKAVSSNGFPLDPLTNTGRHICIHHLLPSIVASPLILPSSPLIVGTIGSASHPLQITLPPLFPLPPFQFRSLPGSPSRKLYPTIFEFSPPFSLNHISHQPSPPTFHLFLRMTIIISARLPSRPIFYHSSKISKPIILKLPLMDQSALPMALSHGLFMAAPVAPNSLATTPPPSPPLLFLPSGQSAAAILVQFLLFVLSLHTMIF